MLLAAMIVPADHVEPGGPFGSFPRQAGQVSDQAPEKIGQNAFAALARHN
jgi:hypothetical protein